MRKLARTLTVALALPAAAHARTAERMMRRTDTAKVGVGGRSGYEAAAAESLGGACHRQLRSEPLPHFRRLP